jgi:hypothetical protein
MSPVKWNGQNDDFQVLPIRQVEIVFTGVSSFRKVRYSNLTVYFWDLTINHLVQKELQ